VEEQQDSNEGSQDDLLDYILVAYVDNLVSPKHYRIDASLLITETGSMARLANSTSVTPFT
jgi:hypothetical protein